MNLVINSRFRPFTYDEMIKPVVQYKEAYEKVEQDYSNLVAQTEMWKDIANRENNPIAYDMYNRYSNDLAAITEDFSKGMNLNNRRALLNMKKRYAQDIVPIANAFNARAQEIKEQTAGRSQGVVYEGDASSASLDRYLENPSIKYRSANSQEGFKRVASAAGALAKELRSYGKGKKIDPYVNTWLQQHGYSSSDINQAITDIEGALRGDGNVKGNNILSSILANEMYTSGVIDWDKGARMDYYNRIAPALYQAVGQTNIGTFDDYGAKLATQASQQQAKQNTDRLRAYNINPSTFYGTSDIVEHNRRVQEDIDTWIKEGLITKDGKLTTKGLRAYQDGIKSTRTTGTSTSGAPQSNEYTDYSFRDRVKSLSSLKDVSGKILVGDINSAIADIRNQLASGSGPVGTMNIDVYRQSVRDKTTQEYLLNKATAAIGGGKIYEANTLNQDRNGVVSIDKGKKGLTREEFEKKAKDYPILYITNSPVTDDQLIELSDGSKYIMPSDMLDNISLGLLRTANYKIRNSKSDIETGVNLNRANSYIGTLLNYNEGTGVSTNDGTIIIQ